MKFLKKPAAGESLRLPSRWRRTISSGGCIWVSSVAEALRLSRFWAFTYLLGFLTGKMKDLAFIQDPDGYWIEILSPNNMVSLLLP